MRPERRQWALRLLAFALLLGVGGWPWPAVQIGFSRVLSAIGNVGLASFHVGPGAEIELVPLAHPTERSLAQNVQEDTHVVLRVPGRPGEARVGISLRRDAYLPLLIFVAAVSVLPLAWRPKLACLALGASLVVAVAIASVATLVVFLSSRAPGTGIPAWQAELSSFFFERWLTPPGNRVIAPLLLAAGLGLAAQRARQVSARVPSDVAVPPGADATS